MSSTSATASRRRWTRRTCACWWMRCTGLGRHRRASMELKEFVRITLEQIVEGAALAQDGIKKKGGIINPSRLSFQKDGHWNNYSSPIPQEVLFDVGLTTSDKSGSAEGVGVFLGGINLGKKNDAGAEQIAVTRVRFAIPLVLPPGEALAKAP